MSHSILIVFRNVTLEILEILMTKKEKKKNCIHKAEDFIIDKQLLY